jgi:hypothetical protein
MKKAALVSILAASLLVSACAGSTLTLTSATTSTTTATQTQRPWPELNVYDDATKTITVKTGQRFVIAYVINGYPLAKAFLEETHDNDMISFLGTQTSPEPTLPDPDYDKTFWFLFEALKPGATQIAIKELTYHFATGQTPILLD